MATPTTKSPKAPQVAPLAAAKAKVTPVTTAKVDTAPASSETKTAREHKATREACAIVRKELALSDKIHKGKANNSRQGSLRFNIVAAIQGSKTVAEACEQEVNGLGKYETETYRVKKVDVGFALGNGFITITK